ncbi:MAG: LacI family DNA-binding transcriptional regulator [Verrucomicrobiales bacterium]|nr:LacI family DNA-binding transcriptional regulator [Verrucomicrobiales bacterium]
MVRLKDIAERAHVSIMTVSKVLRDAPDISAATKAKVRALASEMGYVPHAMAAGLRTRATRLLGLIIPGVVNPVYARLIMALEDRAYELGFDLFLAHTLEKPEREEFVIRRLLARRVEGLFVIPIPRLGDQPAIYSELSRLKLPLVVLGPAPEFCAGFPRVAADEISASREITQHLLDLGHRRIAFLSGRSVCPSALARLEGYRRALRDAGMEVDDRLILQAGSGIEDGFQSGLEIIRESLGVTAIQAVNDLVAIGAMNALLSQHIRVPEDVSVAGFGNILTAEHGRVPLTTAREPKFRLGVAAMEVMQNLLRGKPPENRTLRAELVIRASTAPAAVNAAI